MQHFIYISFLCVVLFPFEASAQLQKKNLQGYVLDTAGVAMKGVNVRLTSSSDTVVISTNRIGYYKFVNIRGANIKLTYHMLGYQILEKSFPIYDGVEDIQVLPITLKPQSSLLKEILISKVTPIVFKLDTVQYNMGAYSFRQRALLEDALKQLPNIQVSRDGSVYAYGKQISFVQVDGKKFFGGDVLTATRNLPIDFVKNIQIIDFYGDQANAKGTPSAAAPEKILNIVLKDDRKKISFGQGTLGGGTENRYLGSLGLNRFNDGQELSILGSMNNTNTNLFSFGAPAGGERERSTGELSDFADPTDGLNKVSSLSASFSDNISDKTTISGRYSYLKKKNITQGNSLLQSLYANSSIFNYEDYRLESNDDNHAVSFNIESKLNKNDILRFTPKLSYSRTKLSNIRDKNLSNRRLTTLGNYSSKGIIESPNAELEALYIKYFNKPGRKLIANLTASFHDMRKEELITDQNRRTDSTFSVPVVTDTKIEQQIFNKNENNQLKFSASYLEPTYHEGQLEISYDYEVNKIFSQRSVQDMLMDPSLFNYVDSLGVNYDYIYSANRVGINYQIERKKKLKFNLGFAVQPMTLSGKTADKLIKTSYDNVNLVPTFGLRWRINNDTDWSINYMGRNNQPSFYQIQPVVDNSNTQYIVIGNPDLKAEFSNRISTKLRKSIVSRGQYFEADFAVNIVANKIVTEKTTDPNSTIQQTKFRNTSGYFDVKSYYLFSTPIINDDFQLNFSGNYNLYNNVSYANDRKNYGDLMMLSQSLQMRYMLSDYLETEFNGNYTLNRVKYEWPFNTNITAQTYVMSVAAKGYLGKRWTVGAEFSQRFNKGYTFTNLNINPTVINAYVEYTFLPNNLALLRLQGFDLLNQNTGISREILGNEVLDIQNNRLSRYFMVSLNIRLQKYPKKSK
ncbi:TonB-dependent receptor [Rhinopithecimicrobium faecis]